jgi:hypothetical protein
MISVIVMSDIWIAHFLVFQIVIQSIAIDVKLLNFFNSEHFPQMRRIWETSGIEWSNFCPGHYLLIDWDNPWKKTRASWKTGKYWKNLEKLNVVRERIYAAELVLSCQDLQEFAWEHFVLEVIPILDQTDMIIGIKEVLSERDASKSESCRLIFLDAGLKHLTNFLQQVKCQYQFQ